MAENGENPQPNQENEAPTPEQIRTRELGEVARKVLSEKATASAQIPEADRTDADKVLSAYNDILQFKQGDQRLQLDGNGLKIPGFKVDGTDIDFQDNEVAVAGITEVTDDGFLKVVLKDKDGNFIPNADNTDYLTIEMPREEVLHAQFHAEKNKIAAEFGGENHALLMTFAEALPQNARPVAPGPDAEDLIDRVAENQNMLRKADIEGFMNMLPAEKRTPELQAAFDALQGNKLATAEDFRKVVEAAGYDDDALAAEAIDLPVQKSKLEADLGALTDPESEDMKKKAQLEAELSYVNDPDGAGKAESDRIKLEIAGIDAGIDRTKNDLQSELSDVDNKLPVFEKAHLAMEATKPPPPPEAPEVDVQTTERVTRVIDGQIKSLDALIRSNFMVEGKGPNDTTIYTERKDLDKDEKTMLAHAKRIRAELTLAEKATGITGPVMRAAALESVVNGYNNELKELRLNIPKNTTDILDDADFKAQLTTAQGEIQRILGKTDEEMAEALANPEGMDKLMEDIADEQEAEMFKANFGEEADQFDINKLYDALAEANIDINDPNWFNKAKDIMGHKYTKRAGWFLLLLAGLTAAVAVGTAAVGVGAVGAAAKGTGH